MTQTVSILKKKKLWVLLILGAVCLYPFQSTIAPSQNVLVVTEDWRPVQGAKLRQSWQHYSLESTGHEEDLFTDENGRASFPRRTERANLLWRAFRPLSNIARQGVHASFGIRTEILELGGGTARPLPSRTVAAQPGDSVFRLH